MAYKNIVTHKVGDKIILNRDVISFSSTLEKGDEVVITYICEFRGYYLKHKPTGIQIIECGWDV